MSEPKMTKGYALVVCENSHGIWGGETEEEAQKHVHSQCMNCDADPDENWVDWHPPRVIPPTEADDLRRLLLESQEREMVLREALEPFAKELVSDASACHVGLVSKEKCSRCGPIIRARAVLSRAEGRKP